MLGITTDCPADLPTELTMAFITYFLFKCLCKAFYNIVKKSAISFFLTIIDNSCYFGLDQRGWPLQTKPY